MQLKENEPCDDLILEVAHFQYRNNLLYHNYVDSLKIAWSGVDSVLKIPFLPISFFKSHIVKTGQFDEEAIFTSSTTTGAIPSRHFIKDLADYEEVFLRIFQKFYGSPEDYLMLGLLPSYLERNGSSLVLMVQKLIEKSCNKESGFFLYDHQKLANILTSAEASGQKTFLIGVTFALLDFAEKHKLSLKHSIVMETGGMKGRKVEMIRDEVSAELKKAFGCKTIHSEYGMTELMSQAYSAGEGIFRCPPWMKILIRDTSDPLAVSRVGSGALNIIDLANVHSCCFIATQDLGKVHKNEDFEVTGRMDAAEVRGCNLLVI